MPARRFFARALPLLTLLLLLIRPQAALAQTPIIDGVVSVGSGLEGADTGNGWLQWQRARVRVSIGFDYGNSERPWEAWGVRGLADLEKSPLVGTELRYTRWLGGVFGAYGAGVAMLTPESLAGLGAGGILQIPLGPVGLLLDGSFTALPAGSDRVDNGMVFWALLNLGIRVRL